MNQVVSILKPALIGAIGFLIGMIVYDYYLEKKEARQIAAAAGVNKEPVA